MTLISVKEKMTLAAGKTAKAMATATFIGIVGCSLVGGYAFANAKKEAKIEQSSVRWTETPSGWEQVSGGYRCTGTEGICTRTYPTGQNPNDNENGFLSQENGTFVQ